MTASALAQDAQPQPVSPGEIDSGVRIRSTLPTLVQSNDGRWLTIATSKGEGLQDLEGNKTYNTPGWSIVWNGGAWSPAGSALSVGKMREGRTTLVTWAGSPEALQGTKEDAARELMVFPRDLYVRLPAIWSPDGKTLYFVINQNLPWPKSHPDDDNPPWQSVNVDLRMTAPYRQIKQRPRFEKEYPEAYGEANRSLIVSLDIASHRLGVLARGNDVFNLALSPDGKRLAVAQLKQDLEEVDIYLLDTVDNAALSTIDLENMEDRRTGWSDHAGKRLWPVLARLSRSALRMMWSPDSARIAYISRDDDRGNLFVYEIGEKASRSLTESAALEPSAKALGYTRQDRLGFSGHMWLDGSTLVAQGGSEVWAISTEPGTPLRLLTKELPYESREVLFSRSRKAAALDAQGRITVMIKDRRNRLDSFWKVDTKTGRATAMGETNAWVSVMIDDARRDGVLYIAQNETSSTNVHGLKLDGASNPEFVTRYKLELAQRLYPDTRVLQYQTPEGRTGFGLLYLPATATPATKVPLVVALKERNESVVDERLRKGAAFYTEETHTLLAEGFAVLYPDVPMSRYGEYERPMKQAVDGVMIATDAALATGLIDATKMGIMGANYGGFMVQAVVTQTSRFKAAVSVSAVANWFGNYLQDAGYHEGGAPRMAMPLWEDPARYVENSPITYWDKVHTPLLIIGEASDRSRPEEGYMGLERLERTGIYARYARRVTQEAANRTRGWFREHLLGAPAITQTADQGSFMLGGSQDAPPAN